MYLIYIHRPTISTLFPYTTLFRSIALLNYRLGDFFTELKFNYAIAGKDSGNSNIGSNIFISDEYGRSEEHTSELQSQSNLVCRLLLEKKKIIYNYYCYCRQNMNTS